MTLSEINSRPLAGMTKGWPPTSPAACHSEVAAMGWNLLRGDLPLPVMIIRDSALERNERWMQALRKTTGILMAPHGKTTMCPQLFQRQLDGGAWAITVATVHQLVVCRHFGIQRVVLANQLIGRQEIDYVVAELAADRQFEFFCLVDSIRAVELLAQSIDRNPPGRPLKVFVEGGAAGGRTGCRSIEDALKVARAIKASEGRIALCGVEGFEGLDTKADDGAIRAFLQFLVGIAEACEESNLFEEGEVILSAGGSAFFDLVIESFSRAGLRSPVKILTRSGCYITHDSAMYSRAFERILGRSPELEELAPPLEAAIEVWAYVQSRPELGKALLTIGKRDVSYDVEFPIPLSWLRPGLDANPQPIPAGHVVTGLNDQHTHMALPPDSPLQVGDMVSFGISHPCTTFDKWQNIFLVDDRYNVVGSLRTYF